MIKAAPRAVALFIFKRPELTRQVFDVIRRAQPDILIVVSDAARAGDTATSQLCDEARRVTELVDWECSVYRDYAELNLGVQRRIETGLDFVFEHVEQAIILEDDCLPHPEFFPYCYELLERYADDDQIAMISGDNSMRVPIGDASYAFTRYSMIWGWASWRRFWHRHDPDMQSWPDLRSTKLLDSVFQSELARDYWSTIFDGQFEKKHNTWDYGVTYTCLSGNYRSVVPATNLVTNTGFGVGAHHTHDAADPRAFVPSVGIGRLVHPSLARRYDTAEVDAFIERSVFSGDPLAFTLAADR